MKYITTLDFLGWEYVRHSEFSNWWLHKVQTRGSVIYSYILLFFACTYKSSHNTSISRNEEQIIKRQLASWSISTLSKLRSSEQALTVFQQQFFPACFNSQAQMSQDVPKHFPHIDWNMWKVNLCWVAPISSDTRDFQLWSPHWIGQWRCESCQNWLGLGQNKHSMNAWCLVTERKYGWLMLFQERAVD